MTVGNIFGISAVDRDNHANTATNKRTNSRAKLKALARRQAAKRSFTTAPALTLALLAAPFAMTGQAEAAGTCSPVSPVTNTTVTCTGVVTDQQGGGVGYGTAADNNNIYNVSGGSSVTGTNTGFSAGSGGVFNIGNPSFASGVQGGTTAILTTGDTTVNVIGANIIGNGATGRGIDVGTTATVNVNIDRGVR